MFNNKQIIDTFVKKNIFDYVITKLNLLTAISNQTLKIYIIFLGSIN